MKNSFEMIKISTVSAVLIFFQINLFSSVISNEKLYFPLALNPETEISAEYIYKSGTVLTPEFLFPLKAGICLDFSCDIINSSTSGGTVLGDSELELNMLLPLGNGGFLSSISFSILLPNGPDAGENQDFKYLSYGKDMFSISLRSLFKIRKLLIYSGLKYCMISVYDELYRGIYLNPLEGKTWETLYGLNFNNKDSFFFKGNLKDDFLNFNIAADYIFLDAVSAGPVLQCHFNWNDGTAIETGFRSYTFLLGAEMIYSPGDTYGFKFQYSEVLNSGEIAFDRSIFFSFFCEI
ncbi:MAG: hypothetical protein JW982_10095 [Spirochaetes bacterium]|nr:hypothetical protein [Spirochaetota bacterium]